MYVCMYVCIYIYIYIYIYRSHSRLQAPVGLRSRPPQFQALPKPPTSADDGVPEFWQQRRSVPLSYRLRHVQHSHHRMSLMHFLSYHVISIPNPLRRWWRPWFVLTTAISAYVLSCSQRGWEFAGMGFLMIAVICVFVHGQFCIVHCTTLYVTILYFTELVYCTCATVLLSFFSHVFTSQCDTTGV